jgi:hypothetical protein
MKLIWWGNVAYRQEAGELLDIIDQIHDYAIRVHRQFVAKHLETWLARAEEANLSISRESSLESESGSEPGLREINNRFVGVRRRSKKQRLLGCIATDDEVRITKLVSRLEKSRPPHLGPKRRRRRKSRVIQESRAKERATSIRPKTLNK